MCLRINVYNESQQIKCQHDEKGEGCKEPAIYICQSVYCCRNRGCSKNICDEHTYSRCSCILRDRH